MVQTFLPKTVINVIAKVGKPEVNAGAAAGRPGPAGRDPSGKSAVGAAWRRGCARDDGTVTVMRPPAAGRRVS
eukprot:96388-Hanusia_phi.AAC.3